MPQRANGAKNLSELTKEEKDFIVKTYFEKTMTIAQMTKHFNLTSRTMPALLKEYNISSKRKNRYTLNERYFATIDTERKAYWLGYLYADGFVGDEKHNNIVFLQKNTDGYAVEQFASDINFDGVIRTTKNVGGFAGELQKVINFSSKVMADDLRELKMETRKSMTMTDLPPIPSELMRHFIRGYFDGDGSISRSVRHRYKNGRLNYKYLACMIGTEPFLRKIADLLPCQSHFVDSHTPEMKYLYVWNKAYMEPMFHYLYDDASFCLVRKYNIWLQILGDLGVKASEEKRDKPDKGCPTT